VDTSDGSYASISVPWPRCSSEIPKVAAIDKETRSAYGIRSAEIAFWSTLANLYPEAHSLILDYSSREAVMGEAVGKLPDTLLDPLRRWLENLV
jgi:hypothetical protein